ncbi:MAG: fibronectin type III domain-containing protein [Bacteroides sp.]|nr:fibronectin type III domain-containing protein [Bacteroidales bacterium]MCM1353582.1 fibronectin type III domain-containing protein [Bacteroides sp.]MCM1403015.1 fibronectin type III domain-containing protein [Bacteroides sp.]MCM1442743.1 fibronectin type III domain-containing protein [Muribaculum sp.]
MACLLGISVVAMAGPSAAPTAPSYPANQVKAVYSATYNADCGFGEWGSSTQYAQEEFGKKYTTTQLGYFGLEFYEGLNCAAMEALHLDVYSDADMSMRIVPIHGGAEVGVTKALKAGEWNVIDIALTEFQGVNDWTNVYQIKIDNASNQTFYLNNIYFYTTQAPDEDTEAPANLTASLVEADYFNATLTAKATDNTPVVIFEVRNGEEVLATKNAGSDVETTIAVTGLKSNTAYTLTVVAKDEAGNQSESVNIQLSTKEAPAAAEAPLREAENVMSIYSDAYEAVTWFLVGSWGQSTQLLECELAEGDKAYYCYNSNYLGWELQGTPLDVSEYTGIHMDIYPVDATSIQYTPIWNGGESLVTTNLLPNQWNALDYQFSEFKGIDLKSVFQMKWAEMPAKMFVDNVYFYKTINSAVDNLTLTNNVQKRIVNGRLVILRNGVQYNALGQIID